MATMTDLADFNLIISNVTTDQIEEAAAKFAAAFSLDPGIATQIVKSAPIIFASDLSKREVKAITPALQELSKLGIEFRVTSRLTKKIPKVNWPVRPNLGKVQDRVLQVL